MAEQKKTKSKRGAPEVEITGRVISLLDSYEGCGTVTDMCEHLGIKNPTFYKWLNNDDRFAEAVQRAREFTDDAVENAAEDDRDEDAVDERERHHDRQQLRRVADQSLDGEGSWVSGATHRRLWTAVTRGLWVLRSPPSAQTARGLCRPAGRRRVPRGPEICIPPLCEIASLGKRLAAAGCEARLADTTSVDGTHGAHTC